MQQCGSLKHFGPFRIKSLLVSELLKNMTSQDLSCQKIRFCANYKLEV